MNKPAVRNIKIIRRLILFSSLLFFFHVAEAQYGKTYKKKGDLFFKKQNYYGAAKLYTKALTGSFDSKNLVLPYQPSNKKKKRKISSEDELYLTYQIAESYRLYNDYKDALVMYERYLSIAKKPNPLAQLWYGICLRASNNPEKATAELSHFLDTYKKDDAFAQQATLELYSCHNMLEQIKNPDKVIIHKLRNPFNQEGSNYAMQRINDSFAMFSSSRPETIRKNKVIYPLRVYNAGLQNAKAFKEELNADNMEIAASHLTANGLTAYFTGWHEERKVSKNRYSIYLVKRASINDKWGQPQLLGTEVNVPGFNAKQPFITSDNKFMIFSSDKPGGYGKFDLWMVHLKEGLPFGNAINLGDKINSKGEEITPFYNEATQELFFSTDGRIGIGGMDIFKSNGNITTNTWATPINAGYPVNSEKDDVYYKPYASGDTAYLTSDRASTCCLEIFEIIKQKKTEPKKVDTTIKTNAEPDTIKIVKNDSTEQEKNSKRLLDSLAKITVNRYSVHFDFNKFFIRKPDFKTMDTVIKLLNENPGLNIIVAAFTDCKGTYEVNLRLSKARSKSVKDYLIKHNINPKRINLDFFGENHLILPCKDDTTYNIAEQIANRRADIIVTKEENPQWIPSGMELDLESIKEDLKNGKRPYHESPEMRGAIRKNKKTSYSSEQKSNAVISNNISTDKLGNYKIEAKEVNQSSRKDSSITTNKPSTKNKKSSILDPLGINENRKATNDYNNKSNINDASKKNKDSDTLDPFGLNKTTTQPEESNQKAKSKKTVIPESSFENSTEKSINKKAKSAGTIKKINQTENKKSNKLNNAESTTEKLKKESNDNEALQRELTMLDSITTIKNRLLVAEMSDRATNKIVNVYTMSDSVHIDLYDNGLFDNDSISVIYNKQIKVFKKVLQVEKPIAFSVPIDKDEKKNEMIFYAENLGTIPPNSALMVITDGDGKRTEVSVTNDLKHNTIIYFIKLKKQ